METLKNFFVKRLEKLLSYFNDKKAITPSEEEFVINSLAPKILTEESDIKRIEPYLKSLKAAIDKEGVNNIAITGGYGSGKSTILKTFQSINTDYEYLNISLASFQDNKGKPDDPEYDRKLEISILQQMFYHVEPCEIPDSRFKRIVNLTTKKLYFFSFYLILWAFSALVLLKFDRIKKLNPESWKWSSPFDFITIVLSILFFVGIGYMAKSIYRLFKNSKINKLNIKGELELGEEVDKSVFNQHIEEILYFFERVPFNVVIIEDVDRFESTDIFTKIREINILINNSNLIKRPVKFVYAIKDEMFKDKNERVKFFEFIIPVIPFINPSNANDQLEKLIADANLQGKLSSEFTSDIVTFINDIDMRLLTNIFQEYQIYRSVLSTSLNQDNLFAILVFKNMYPKDFGELSKREGTLYSFLINKRAYISERKEAIESKIDNLKKEISILESEQLTSIQELRALYLYRLSTKLENFYSFYFDGYVSLLEATSDRYFNLIKQGKEITYIKYTVGYGSNISRSQQVKSDIRLSDIEEEVNSGNTYLQREKSVYDRSNNRIDYLRNDLAKQLLYKQNIETSSIQEIFLNIDIRPHLGEYADSYLMRTLLLNGYIDEQFEDYISLFHGISITKTDFEFERSVKSGITLPPDYKLEKIDNLLKKLPERYFKREAILNYNLLDYLLLNEVKYNTKVDFLFEGLSEISEAQFKFIYNYIKQDPPRLANFIKNLCNSSSGLWLHIQAKSNLPSNDIRFLLKLIFDFGENSAIKRFGGLETLKSYISEMHDFFAFCAALNDGDKLLSFISDCNVRIEKLDTHTHEQKKLFDAIYAKNLYCINVHNLINVVGGNGIDVNLEEFDKAQYTTIQQTNLQELNDYLSSNIESYIMTVLTKLESNKREAEETIIAILNRDDVSIEVAEKLLESQATLITDLSRVERFEYKDLVLQQQSVLPTWNNVFSYFDASDMDMFSETLVDFLNEKDSYVALSRDQFISDENRDEVYYKRIANLLLYTNDLNFETYRELIKPIPYSYDKIKVDELDSDKLNALINESKLSLTRDNFVVLKEKQNKLGISLLEVNQDAFLEMFTELSLDAEDWKNIYRSNLITNQNKWLLLQKMDDSIIIYNEEVADAVCEILPVDKIVRLRFEVLSAMFKAHKSIIKKIALLLLYARDIEDDVLIKSLVTDLGLDYVKLFMKQHKPVYPNTEYNRELFTMLKSRDLIIRFELQEKENLIRVIAKYIE